mmetsp:Transcript_31683/g.69246  ORF Transcript_31683/g.69246 Transcript_31683/m.69246 type:complete len:169 (-) Transcript_31683:323-829(-)|eukprot:CAMPEP_0118925582 /NCGR_PEP_ID=MMETSP1169-20130426/3447_1 /TAXON_ID=36882 /ORGANISM="Pyramimonas obovata, Strain CCMP722" /LENGTH=168 /DNA_ID=CAMNT_0006866921 /DNA_START=223 /DNA_END=729 /DNA_ORIENTATION=+
MARLAKGMDPLGLSELSGSDGDEDSDEEEDTKVIEPKKPKQMDFETLSQFGYKSGPSVLLVPDSAGAEQNYNWSSGRQAKEESNDAQETAEERERTRTAMQLTDNMIEQAIRSKEQNRLLAEQEYKERKAKMSFNQREKRKRDAGQATSGKNFVEEEKRILRQSSGYD